MTSILTAISSCPQVNRPAAQSGLGWLQAGVFDGWPYRAGASVGGSAKDRT